MTEANTAPGHNSSTHQPQASRFSPPVIHFLAGGVAGCVSKTVIAPLDRVKILFQTNSPHYPFTGVFSTLHRVAKHEGVADLWKGNMATLLRIFPYAAVQFMSYEAFKRLVFEKLEWGGPGSVVASNGTTATMCTYPLDLLRARLASEVRTRTYRSILHGLQVMYQKEGIRSWFKGMQPTIQGIIPYAGVNFGTYETLKFYLPKDAHTGDTATVWKLFAGGIAGALGQTVAYPWDVLRRRMQTAGFAPGVAEVQYAGTWRALRHIVQREGFIALYRGISINFWKVCPSVSMGFTVYEYMKKTLTKDQSLQREVEAAGCLRSLRPMGPRSMFFLSYGAFERGGKLPINNIRARPDHEFWANVFPYLLRDIFHGCDLVK